MPVVLTIDTHDFIGGPDAHRPYHIIGGTVSCANPYTPGGELLGIDELETAIQTLLGRTDITIAALEQILLGESSDEDAFFRMNAAGTRIVAFNHPSASLIAGAVGTIPTVEEVLAVVPVAHVSAVPAGRILLHAEIATGVATGPLRLGTVAPTVTLTAQYDSAAGELLTLAADDAATVDMIVLNPGTLPTLPTVDTDGTPEEYGAVNISAIECKFLAVVT